MRSDVAGAVMIKISFARTCLAAALAALAGCSDALTYGEGTSFNLAIGVNDDPALPLSVNAGLHRTVVNIVPPLGGDVSSGNTTVARGEAVSSISSFNLTDDGRDTNPLGGTLKIKTQFASGEAAVTIAQQPEAVAVIMGGRFVRTTPTKVKLQSFLGNPRDPQRVNDLRTCMAKDPALTNVALSVFLNTADFETARAGVVQCLKL
jgi:hypothetical protein